jgi:protein SCO1
MRPRTISFVAAALAACAALTACGSASSGPPITVASGAPAVGAGGIAAPSEQLGDTADITVPASIRNLPLTTPSGKTTTLAAYTGKPVMIADFLSLCTDICPMITANTVAMAKALQADGYAGKVALLEISVDPARDTPKRLTAYEKLYGGSLPDWDVLRATPADTKALWQYFHVYYEKTKEPKTPAVDWLTHKPLTYDVEHSDTLIFLDAQGRERFVVDGGPDVGKNIPPAKLVQFLNGEGVHDLYHPDKVEDWTVSQGLSVFSWLLGKRLPSST